MPEEQAGLSELVLRTARVLRRAHRAALVPYGLSPHQSRAMGVILRHGDPGLRLSELATSLDIAPRSATDVVDALERQGLVARHPDPVDRRAVEIRLTAEGLALRRTLERERATVSDRHFAALSDADRRTLTGLLRRALGDD